MLPHLKSLFLLLCLLPGSQLVAQATPRVAIVLQADPATHTFTCRYIITVPATDTAAVLRLNLLRQWHLQDPAAPAQVSRVYYPYFGDTVQQITVRYPAHHAQRLTLSYSGTLDKYFATEHVLEFSGHTIWLPFRPGGEYELVDYTLAVQVPAGYQVRSTTPARRQRAGYYEFVGRTSAIEPTALVARQFYELTTSTKPAITVGHCYPPIALCSARPRISLASTTARSGSKTRLRGSQFCCPAPVAMPLACWIMPQSSPTRLLR
jgi:hypothetical protein